jgi:hypothetical protein
MRPRHISGAIELDRTDHHEFGPSTLSWPTTAPLPLFETHTGDDSAGDGGNGYFAGSVVDHSSAILNRSTQRKALMPGLTVGRQILRISIKLRFRSLGSVVMVAMQMRHRVEVLHSSAR